MEKGRSFKSKRNYLLAFLIGTFVFILVVSLSYYFSYMEFSKTSVFQDRMAYSIFEDKLDYTFFHEGECSQKHFDEITQDLYRNGQIMSELERKLGKDNEVVMHRKKFYSLVEIEHLEFLQMYEENCNLSADYILFFYSNVKDEDRGIDKVGESEHAGRLISTARQNNENVYVYSFDVNLGTELIEKLKGKYNVTSSAAPVAVINGEEQVSDFTNIRNIEKHLD